MSRSRLLLLSLLIPMASCHREASLPEVDLGVRLEVPSEEVEFGKAFPLVVRRVWSKELVPEEWNDQSLAPLVVRLQETLRIEDRERVEEVRSYLGYAFERREIAITPPILRARPRSGGPERMASGAGLKLRVASSLGPGLPGPVELPGDILLEPSVWPPGWIVVVGAAAMLVLAGLGLFWRSRRREESVPPVPMAPEEGPEVRARARLQRLRERPPVSAPEIQAFYLEATDLVKDYLEGRFALRAPEMTTEEFLASPRTLRELTSRHQSLLAGLLAHCDLVKFACRDSSAPERETVLATAATLISETAAPVAKDESLPTGDGRP